MAIVKDELISDYVSESVDTWCQEEVDEARYEESFDNYNRYIARKWIFMISCIIVSVMVMGIALTIGDYSIGFLDSYKVLWQHITGNPQNELYDYIIIELRMPRIVVGLIAGSGLAVAGAVMQSILKNPLADPYTTGVSSGAMLGATMVMTMGLSFVGGHYAIVVNAFVFSLVPVAIILSVSKMKNASPTVMIMAGIAVMYIFNALTTVMKLWSDPNNLKDLFEWSVGSLGNATWEVIPIMGIVTMVGVITSALISRQLNVLATGDENAKALGVNVENMRIISLLVVALMTAAIVSFTGLIGFVGLVAPHIVRIFIGPDNRYLVPASAVFGATLLIGADLIGRVILAPTVLQVGVITAFMGVPLFLWLIVRKKSQVW